MGSSVESIECWGKFDFRISFVEDAEYVSSLDSIRARYLPFKDDIRFREVPPAEAQGYMKVIEDYFTLVFVCSGGEISGLYDRRNLYLFGIRVDNRSTPQPFEILKGMDFNLPQVNFQRVDCGMDYQSLGDPGTASYTIRDLGNAVSILLGGFKKAGIERWGKAMTTLIGATSEAVKSIAMERHVAVGLNIITGNVHTPSRRIVKIMKSWSKISKSIRSGKYDYEMKYTNENGVEITEKVTRYSAGQILAIINAKDGSLEEKQIRKQGKEETIKRKRDDFKETGEGSNRGNLKNLKAQKKSEVGSGSSAGGHKYRGMAGDAESEDDISDFHYDEALEVFTPLMIPHGVYTSSDSDLDSEAEDNKTREDEKTPADDKAPELFTPLMIPHGVYTSSDSDSEAEDDKTPVSEVEKTPAPVFLVKHGTKRPAEAGGHDKGFKRAEEEEMSSEGAEKNPTDDPNEGGRSSTV